MPLKGAMFLSKASFARGPQHQPWRRPSSLPRGPPKAYRGAGYETFWLQALGYETFPLQGPGWARKAGKSIQCPQECQKVTYCLALDRKVLCCVVLDRQVMCCLALDRKVPRCWPRALPELQFSGAAASGRAARRPCRHKPVPDQGARARGI